MEILYSCYASNGGIHVDRASGYQKHFLVASDFDQTLSFNDSGLVLSELIGASQIPSRRSRDWPRATWCSRGGARLSAAARPEFRGVRREHLEETGRRVRLRSNIPALVEFLERGIDGCQFSFFVISAAPPEVIQSALAGVVVRPITSSARSSITTPTPARCARSCACRRDTERCAVIEELEDRASGLPPVRTIYVGDGSSDVHVMLHVNNRDGFTIAVSENKQLARIARSDRAERRCVLGDGADSRPGPRLELESDSARSSNQVA